MNPTDARDTIVKEIAIKAPAERIFVALTNGINNEITVSFSAAPREIRSLDCR